MPDLEMTEARMGLSCSRGPVPIFPRRTIDLLNESDAALFGAITSPTTYDPTYRSPLLYLGRSSTCMPTSGR